jgi:hypothetical protein
MAQLMTPEEIQSTAQNLKKAFEAGSISAEQFNEGMKDVTAGVKNYTANLSAALNQLGTAAKSLGEGMLKGEQGMSQYNNAVVSGGDVVANAAMQFGPLGIAVGALIKIVTFGISQVNDMADGLYKANQDLSKVGAAGAEGMTGVFNNMQKFGYGIKDLGDMTALISQNSVNLAQFGGSVEQGTSQLANAAKGIKNSDLQRQFMNMGMSVNDINKGIAGYVSLQASLGIKSSETSLDLANNAANYIAQQDRLTKLTGQSAEQLQSNQQEAQQVEAFNAKLASMRPEEAAKYQAAFDMMRSTSKTAALGFAASVTGMTGMTKESTEAFQMTGGAIGRLTKQYQDNISSGMESTRAAAIFKQGMADAADKTKGLANSVAMVGGSAGMGSIREHNQLAALAGGKVTSSLDQVVEAQDGQAEGFDKNTNEHTKLMQQQMATRDSFQTLIEKGIGPVTSSFESISKVINRILHPFGGGPKVATPTKQNEGGVPPSAPPGASGDKAAVLDLIGKGESGGNYNRLVSGKVGGPKVAKEADLTNMTLAQVQAYQANMIAAGHASTAVGKYQFIASTLAQEIKRAGLDPNTTKFDSKTQDLLAGQMVDRAGLGTKSTAEVMNSLAGTWASLPKDMSGAGRYDGFNGNKVHIDPKELVAAINSSGVNTTTAKNGRQDSGVSSANLNMPESNKKEMAANASGRAKYTWSEEQVVASQKKVAEMAEARARDQRQADQQKVS